MSASNRLNATGLGDAAARQRWTAAANDALARLTAVAPDSAEERALAIMCARTRLDDMLAKGDFAATIAEAERVLREVVPRLPGDASLGESIRDAGLIRTVLADACTNRAMELLAEKPSPVGEIERLLARALELRMGEVERRRARAESARPEDASRARRDLAVVLERIVFSYRDPNFGFLRNESIARAAEAASATLRAEYLARFIAPLRPGGIIGELHEYTGGEIRFLDFDLYAAEVVKSTDPARFEAESVRYMQGVDRAAGVYLETMLRDGSNLRSYEQLGILLQRCLTPARGLPREATIGVLERIDRVGVVPFRDRRMESFATPDAAARILALRIGVDARRALFLRSGPDDERLAAREAAQRALNEAGAVLVSIGSRERDLARVGKGHRMALLAELELAVALGRHLGLAGVEEPSRAIEALKNDPSVAHAFKERPNSLYYWFELDLDQCRRDSE